MAVSALPIKHNTTSEDRTKQGIFRKEVCKKYCRVCSAEAPDFCMMFLEHLGDLYFDRILFVVNTARELMPRVYDDLETFEGFVALFCDARLCPLYSTGCNLGRKIDCYQCFMAQANMEFEDGESDSVLNLYNSKLVHKLCEELNVIDKRNEHASKKKKKKMKQIAIRIMNMLARWSGKTKVTQIVKKPALPPPPPKEVTTHLFYGGTDEFIARVKAILEGPVKNDTEKVEATNQQ